MKRMSSDVLAGLLQRHVTHAGINPGYVAPEPLESGHGVWL